MRVVGLLSLFPFFPEDEVGQHKCAVSVLTEEVRVSRGSWCGDVGGREASDSGDLEEG